MDSKNPELIRVPVKIYRYDPVGDLLEPKVITNVLENIAYITKDAKLNEQHGFLVLDSDYFPEGIICLESNLKVITGMLNFFSKESFQTFAKKTVNFANVGKINSRSGFFINSNADSRLITAPICSKLFYKKIEKGFYLCECSDNDQANCCLNYLNLIKQKDPCPFVQKLITAFREKKDKYVQHIWSGHKFYEVVLNESNFIQEEK